MSYLAKTAFILGTTLLLVNCLSDPDNPDSTPEFAQNIVGLWFKNLSDSVIYIRGYTKDLYYFDVILPADMEQRKVHDTLDYLWNCSKEKQLKVNTEDSSFRIEESFDDCEQDNHIKYDWKPEFDSNETHISYWFIYHYIDTMRIYGVTVDSIYDQGPRCEVSYSYHKTEPVLKRMDYTPQKLTREQCAGR